MKQMVGGHWIKQGSSEKFEVRSRKFEGGEKNKRLMVYSSSDISVFLRVTVFLS